jgi:hypothetical protein
MSIQVLGPTYSPIQTIPRERGQSVNLTTQFHLVARIRICGATLHFSIHLHHMVLYHKNSFFNLCLTF